MKYKTRRRLRINRQRRRRTFRKQYGGMNLSHYNSLIGAGGFGKVIKHESDPTVVKLYYTKQSCDESAKEYNALEKAYSAVEPLYIQGEQIYVPKPIGFESIPHAWKGEDFQCVLHLGYVNHLPEYSGLVHTIFKEEYKRFFNKDVGREYMKPVAPGNPSRGFFATGSYLDAVLLPNLTAEQKGLLISAKDIAYRLGLLYGLLVIGGIYPFDVEFSLGVVKDRLHLIALDFNLAMPIESTTEPSDVANRLVHGTGGISGAGEDLYMPYTGDPTFADWKAGIMRAMKFGKPRDVAILTEFITKYEMEY